MQTEDGQYPISVVEQETGISKELLRMWERRYDFPIPERDASGNRLYSRTQIERLQDINKLLAAGYRPGFVVGADGEKIERLLQELPESAAPTADDQGEVQLEALWDSLQDQDFPAYRRLLRQDLAAEGARQFITQVAAPLQQRLARAELDDFLPGFVIRLAQQQLIEALGLAIAMLPTPDPQGLQILLANLAGENRPVELQMIRTLLLSSGADVLFLGNEPDLDDVLACLRSCAVPVLQIAISAASITAANQQAIARLRREMPAQTSLWLSGSGAEEIDGAGSEPRFRRLRDLLQAVQSWQKPMRKV
ncbi:MerR family transcriptional regulator [Acidithiobacillus sp. IBUN Pt1247-S3]|uniref:MerR family transcriptional regulator n=1 Tax=Acidithiobacillus sp. IBUN Pt1247-S3 TaxID=3166642 RepID=UPI0034E5AE10